MCCAVVTNGSVCVFVCSLQLFVDAMRCECGRTGVSFDRITTPSLDLGVRGTRYYTMRDHEHSSTSEVEVLFKQSSQIKLKDVDILRNFTRHMLEDTSAMSKGVSEEVRESRDSVVIMLQAGTWYNINDTNVFQQHMSVVFSEVHSLAPQYTPRRKHVVFVWAEQVTQHWPTHNGYFLENIHEPPPIPYCTPLVNTSGGVNEGVSENDDWRNDIIWNEYLDESSEWKQKMNLLAPYARVRVLNFRALTRDMSDFHVRQKRKRDCTHYCYTHMMYQSIYHQIAQICEELAADVTVTRSKGFIR